VLWGKLGEDQGRDNACLYGHRSMTNVVSTNGITLELCLDLRTYTGRSAIGARHQTVPSEAETILKTKSKQEVEF
jgi:hypothetical protein